MKRFFARFSLLFLPILWALFLLLATFMNLIEGSIDTAYQLFFLCMTGALLLSVLFSIFAQAFSSKCCAIFGLICGSLHFLPLLLDGMDLSPFNGFASFYSPIPTLISVLIFMMIIASSILVFCRKKAPAASPAAAGNVPFTLPQNLQDDMNVLSSRLQKMEAEVANMGSFLQRMPKLDGLQAGLAALTRKYDELEGRLAQPAAPIAPVQAAPAPQILPAEPVTAAAEIPAEEIPVETAPAPVEEPVAAVEEAPAEEIAAEEAATEEVPAEAAPAEEIPAPAVESSAPAEAPAPMAAVPVAAAPAPVNPIKYFLQGSKGSCTITETGIRYQIKGEDFFAPYTEINNLYIMLGVYYMMYKGKDYHLDVNDKSMLKAAFAFAQEKWNAAKAQAPQVPPTPRNDNEPIFNVETGLATLQVFDSYCVLTAKKNAMTLLVTNKFYAGEKKFYYADLTSVQFREPGTITDGYMEFETLGAHSSNNSAAYTSENAIAFTKNHLPLMREIYAFVDGKIREYKERKNQPVVATVSAADELKKYKELLDADIITKEEFDLKKKHLMGL